MTAEVPDPAGVDLVRVNIETTRVNAQRVASQAIAVLSDLAMTLGDSQREQILAEQTGAARYTNHQIGMALSALLEAQELKAKLTPQGESKHEND